MKSLGSTISIASVVICMLVQSCALRTVRPIEAMCDDSHVVLFPFGGSRPSCEIIGKVRIELPRYRLRGMCRILHDSSGKLRIDVENSSLFGSVHGNLSLIATDESVAYEDGDSGWVRGDSVLADLSNNFGAAIYVEDLLYALLLAVPLCSDVFSPSIERKGETVYFRGIWRGKKLELKGKRGEGVIHIRECSSAGSDCFIVKYSGKMSAAEKSYPRRIRLYREGGKEEIRLEVVSVRFAQPDSSEFIPGF